MTRNEVFVAIAALLQASLMKIVEFVALPVLHRPDLLLTLAVVVGWSSHPWAAAWSGFALGLIDDLIGGRALGVRAVSLGLAAAVSSSLKRLIRPDAALSKMVAASISATVADLLSFAALRGRGSGVTGTYFIRWIWPATVVWAVVLVLPADWVTRRLAQGLGRLWPAPDETRRRERTV